jgi:hypothetical protein
VYRQRFSIIFDVLSKLTGLISKFQNVCILGLS